MHTIDTVVIAFAALAALTKLIDVFSTIRCVKTIDTERNPIGKALFRRFGVAGGCWLTFAVQVLVCALVAWEAVLYSGTAEKAAVAAVCGLLTYLNVSTGFHNVKGYDLPLTKGMIRFYGWLATRGK